MQLMQQAGYGNAANNQLANTKANSGTNSGYGTGGTSSQLKVGFQTDPKTGNPVEIGMPNVTKGNLPNTPQPWDSGAYNPINSVNWFGG
jgi:hypothetical protein